MRSLTRLGLFWTWVVLEKPCRVYQHGRGGRIDADFLGSEGGRSLGAELAWPPKIKRIRRSESAVLNTA